MKLSQKEPKSGNDQASEDALEAMKSAIFNAALKEVNAMVQSAAHKTKRELQSQFGAKRRL